MVMRRGCIGRLARSFVCQKIGGIGFWDLYSFNLAMLDKQAWRLVDHPYSLYAKVLKANYHPNSYVLNAGPKAGSSFTW